MSESRTRHAWNRTVANPVSDFEGRTLAGVVREWEHPETGDTITIRFMDDGIRFYRTEYNGEGVEGHATLREAERSVVETLRACDGGLEADGGE